MTSAATVKANAKMQNAGGGDESLPEVKVTLPLWVNKFKDYFEFVKQESCEEANTKRTRTRFTLRCLICKSDHQKRVKESSNVSKRHEVSKSRKKPKDSLAGGGFTITSKSSDSFKRHLQVCVHFI